jgi:hypothetical protein
MSKDAACPASSVGRVFIHLGADPAGALPMGCQRNHLQEGCLLKRPTPALHHRRLMLAAIQNARLFEEKEAPAGGRISQRGEERFPGNDEPRNPHSDERHH